MNIVMYKRIIPSSSPQCLFVAANKSWGRQRGLCTTTNLQPLPVPELDKTIEKFLNIAKPLQSFTDYQRTIKIAEEFQQSEEAKYLQKLLEERAKKFSNWLTPWWLEIAYLSARTPLPVVTSPGVTFPYFKFSGLDGQIDCAAKIIQAALKFHHKILRNELEADKSRGTLLDMSQYKFLFGTTRIPRQTRDTIRYGKDQPVWANHILVTRNGHSFQMQICDESRQMLGLNLLRSQLKDICAISSQPKIDAINIVSSDDRESWARVYERIKEKNSFEVQIMENALFVMCLDKDFGDEGKPEDRNMAMALHGGGARKNSTNRWFDKTLQFYINENGYGGMTYEHTPAEGPPLAKLLDFICDEINHGSFEDSDGESFQKPHELFFNLDSSDREAIKRAEAKLEKIVQNLEVKSLVFCHFGKNMPKRAQLSPDSWIQLAFQLAYFRIHNAHPPAYETGTLRKFLEGRTDTIRLPTMESVHFLEALSKFPRPPTITDAVLMTLLESAIASHKQYSLDVMNGQGIDRHLLGLKLIAAENGLPLPELLKTDAYKKLTHFLLSTSQVPTKHVLPMGFGPSDPDCYGICYNPQDCRIFFTITAYNECRETSAEKFANELSTALLDMRDVVDKAGRLKEMEKSKL